MHKRLRRVEYHSDAVALLARNECDLAAVEMDLDEGKNVYFHVLLKDPGLLRAFHEDNHTFQPITRYNDTPMFLVDADRMHLVTMMNEALEIIAMSNPETADQIIDETIFNTSAHALDFSESQEPSMYDL